MSDTSSTVAATASDASTHVRGALALFLFAESPVHAGAGGSEAAVDLPIQRSVQTEWPILNDSTVRGGLRRLVDDPDAYFGKPDDPGKLVTPDAEMLAFPVASAKGMTCWVTCAAALNYFVRKLEVFRLVKTEDTRDLAKWVGNLPQGSKALLPAKSAVAWTHGGAGGIGATETIVLESDRFDVERHTEAAGIAKWLAARALPFESKEAPNGSLAGYWANRFCEHFAVVPDEAFTHYVKHKTDIRTRVKIGDNGVVAPSGPWTEENLPVDTLLYTVLAEAEGAAGRLSDWEKSVGVASMPVIQLGGDQNLGRGLLRIRKMGV